MKKAYYLLLAVTAMTTQSLRAQVVYPIKADSIMVTNGDCDAELILENGTRGIPGVLYNKGNGRTEFRKFQKLSNSSFVLGGDTITIDPKGPTNALYDTLLLYNTRYIKHTGNDFGDTMVIGTLDNHSLQFKNYVPRMYIWEDGNVTVGYNFGNNGSKLFNDRTSVINGKLNGDTITGRQSVMVGGNMTPRFATSANNAAIGRTIGADSPGGFIYRWNNPSGSQNTDIGWANGGNGNRFRIGRYADSSNPTFHPTITYWPADAISINEDNPAALNSRLFYINGSLGANKDSLPAMTSLPTWQFLIQDSGTNRINRTSTLPADHSMADYAGKRSLTTANATTSTLVSYTPSDSQAGLFECRIIGQTSTGSAVAVFRKLVRFNKQGGVVSLGSIHSPHPDDIESALSGCSVNITSSGGNILAQVIGISGSVQWKATYNAVVN
ncbi:MAG: hypothetical protein P0Y53_18965 [Candidatus Pseudobacter hemicellulosilyticus]|uniref:Uncharacterized protein n=1 Tax=Candidatus Pseudobacter hemicellulosilyticus TaxID=3121375 RepID=A0AAJ5WRW9_9BACT|nr:MAG: hypothetical protein P0Y53_18965 [Pseudobacter sp.]